MKVSIKILPLCVVTCLFSLNVFAVPPRSSAPTRPSQAPMPPSSLPVLSRPVGPSAPNQGPSQGKGMEEVSGRSSMPAGLMRIPTDKSTSAAVEAQRVEREKKRVTAADVYRAWDAPGSQGFVTAEYPHQDGVVRQLSDPSTGQVLGFELTTFDGVTWPYNPSTNTILSASGQELSIDDGKLEVSRSYDVGPLSLQREVNVDPTTRSAYQYEREIEGPRGTEVEVKVNKAEQSISGEVEGARGREFEMTNYPQSNPLQEYRLKNGTSLKFDPVTGEVPGSTEYRVSASGNPTQSTLYVQMGSDGKAALLEVSSERLANGRVIISVTDQDSGATRTYVEDDQVGISSGFNLTIGDDGVVRY
jgi:hypothetical protein